MIYVITIDETYQRNFDNTYIFKNFYNNWCNKTNFIRPILNAQEKDQLLTPSFGHIKELYDIEKGKPQKMAYKLTEQVLHPKAIEKTSAKLADAAFHESTTNALFYYSKNG